MNQSSSNSIEQTVNAITPFAILFFVFGFIAFIVVIAYVIRLWLTQTATFQIQKDVADIRDHLLGLDKEDLYDRPQAVANGYVEPLDERSEIGIKRPSNLFLWIAISIPLLLICLVVALNVYQ